jgi:serine/threonine protein kinase/tetratricopeptide (TPR) repeat protein
MSDPNQEESLFDALLALPPEQRAAYLDRACADNTALRARLENLLRAHEQSGGFLEKPVTPAGSRTFSTNIPAMEKPGDRIGRYKLLQQIGEGGCGVVYMAEQEEPVRRKVALKVIKLGMDTKSVIARFEAERQALAMMDHPNIAKVLDAGATEAGRPYFVMELVRGVKITDFCDEQNLPTQARLDLFMQVCRAIEHAHQKGIIHRDIKPSNILVTLHDETAVPKVIDFGIAKATQGRLTDHTVFTAFEQFMGTPAYMSPEQTEMNGLDVDTRSDIYSLGVLLYELLTGQTPFDTKELLQSGLNAMCRTIREKEPAQPSTRLSRMQNSDLTTVAQRRRTQPPRLIHSVSGDLDWIVMKALEKDRKRRYETASGFARDVQRHLNDEPVEAHKPGGFYRLQKSIRRNKMAFSAGGIVAATLIVGLIVSTWMFFREREARQRADVEAMKSKEVAQFLQQMLAGVGPSVARGRDTALLREIADKTAARLDTELTNTPEVEAELCDTLGRVYWAIDENEKAEQMFRRALELRRKLFGEDNKLTADTLNGLARALKTRNKLAEAETAAREALGIRKKIFGDENAEVAESLFTLALVLQAEGLDEGITVGREALAMQRKVLGNDNPVTAESLNALAYTLAKKGKYDEAEEMFHEALATDEKVFGRMYPETANALDNLATMYFREGKLPEAEAAVRQALVIQTNLFGFNHTEVGNSLNDLGGILAAEGKLTEAEAVDRQAIASYKGAVGDAHPLYAASLSNLGVALEKQGRLAEAESLYRQSLVIRQTFPYTPNASNDVQRSLNHIAKVLREEGKPADGGSLTNGVR